MTCCLSARSAQRRRSARTASDKEVVVLQNAALEDDLEQRHGGLGGQRHGNEGLQPAHCFAVEIGNGHVHLTAVIEAH